MKLIRCSCSAEAVVGFLPPDGECGDSNSRRAPLGRPAPPPPPPLPRAALLDRHPALKNSDPFAPMPSSVPATRTATRPWCGCAPKDDRLRKSCRYIPATKSEMAIGGLLLGASAIAAAAGIVAHIAYIRLVNLPGTSGTLGSRPSFRPVAAPAVPPAKPNAVSAESRRSWSGRATWGHDRRAWGGRPPTARSRGRTGRAASTPATTDGREDDSMPTFA